MVVTIIAFCAGFCDTEVEISAGTGRQTLLPGLQDDYPDLAFGPELLSDSIVEYLLGV